jgi:tRNA threonylcarbamoyladenosine biosynthesis protein TsaB
VGSPDDLAADLLALPGETLLVGDGAIRHAELLAAHPEVEVAGADLAHPSARSLVQLAHARALREDWIRPHEVELLYLRRPDAEINWSVREGA